MRAALRLLTDRLPAFTQTGLTGVLTHPHPRPTLMALYNHTLTVLADMPASSVYRTATENLTKHRLSVVASVTPPNHAKYQEYLAWLGLPYASRPVSFAELGLWTRATLKEFARQDLPMGTELYIKAQLAHVEHIPEPPFVPGFEKLLALERGADQMSPVQEVRLVEEFCEEQGLAKPVGLRERLEGCGYPVILEPQLRAEQIEKIEAGIGDGLIEEVIEQGWAELRCAESVKESRAWEPLEEAPLPGQWEAFQRTEESLSSAN